MSWEGYSWLLSRAIKPSDAELMQLLHPSDERQVNALMQPLRTMGHVLEHALNSSAQVHS